MLVWRYAPVGDSPGTGRHSALSKSGETQTAHCGRFPAAGYPSPRRLKRARSYNRGKMFGANSSRTTVACGGFLASTSGAGRHHHPLDHTKRSHLVSDYLSLQRRYRCLDANTIANLQSEWDEG